MEPLGFYGITLLAFIASVLIPCLLIYVTKLSDFSHPNLPPGKMGFPIIGESLQFLSAARNGYAYKFLWERITKYSSPVFKTSIFGKPMVMVCGSSATKFLFTNEYKLVTLWLPDAVGKIVLSNGKAPSAEKAKKLRGVLNEIFKPQALHKFISVMDNVAQTCFEADWEQKQQVSVFPLAKKYTLLVGCKILFGLDDGKQSAELLEDFDRLMKGIYSIPINLPGTHFSRGMKASKVMRKELMEIIKQRKIDLAENRASPTQDILSQMLVTSDEDGEFMNEMEIANNIMGFLVAGSDSSTSVITFVVKFLSEFPHIYEEVFKEQMEIMRSKGEGESLDWNDVKKMKYSWNVVCETMRRIPFFGSFREAIKDFDFSGYTIPKGWKLYWNPVSTHMDPNCFQEPEKFDPTRFEGKGPAPFTFIPFGGGARICPGKDYVRYLILVFVHNLVKRFRCEKVLPHEEIIMQPLPFPAKGLPVRLFPHDV